MLRIGIAAHNLHVVADAFRRVRFRWHRDGAKFGTIAKQFGYHLCLSPILSKGWQIDRRFLVVRYEGKVPAMASCSNCKRKFFTPTALARDAVAAEEYLGHKFDTHECEELKR